MVSFRKASNPFVLNPRTTEALHNDLQAILLRELATSCSSDTEVLSLLIQSKRLSYSNSLPGKLNPKIPTIHCGKGSYSRKDK